MKVTIDVQEQAALINEALAGKYQAVTWRQFGAVVPDLNYVWWSTTTVSGPISLNMARNSDARIQAALTSARASADPAVRIKAYQKVNQYLGEDIPYLYGDRSTWAVAAKPTVQNFNNPMTPKGTKALGFDAGRDLARTGLGFLIGGARSAHLDVVEVLVAPVGELLFGQAQAVGGFERLHEAPLVTHGDDGPGPHAEHGARRR